MKKTIVFLCFCMIILICAFVIHFLEPIIGPGAAIFITLPAAAVILMNVAIKVYDRYG